MTEVTHPNDFYKIKRRTQGRFHKENGFSSNVMNSNLLYRCTAAVFTDESYTEVQRKPKACYTTICFKAMT